MCLGKENTIVCPLRNTFMKNKQEPVSFCRKMNRIDHHIKRNLSDLER